MGSIATEPQRQLRVGLGWHWQAWLWLGGLLLFGWGWGISIAYDFGIADETWFLQVLTRVVGGDVLYRDVFFGATPLSVYLAAPLVALFGSEIVVLKAFVALCFVLTVLAGLATLGRLNGSRRSVPFLLLGLLAYVWPRQAAGYTPLAYACLLGCLLVTVKWQTRLADRHRSAAPSRSLVSAGVLAGLCFAAKQNLGLCALGALLASIALVALQERVSLSKTCRALLTAFAAFTLTVGVTLLPVLLSGGIEQFIDYGFTNKRTYLRIGGFSYLEGLRALDKRIRTIHSPEDLRWVFLQTSFLLPPLTCVVMLVASIVATKQQRLFLAITGIFAAAALAGVYPRADIEHVLYAIPPVLVCAVYAAGIVGARLPRAMQRMLSAGFVLWMILGIGLIGSGALGRILSPDFERSTLPHFGGVWLTKEEHAKLQRYATTLRAATEGEQPFLLSSQAAFYYLAAGLDNPTPFDYPLETAFGLHGQADVMAAIREGRIRWVCLKHAPRYQMAAHRLAQFVIDHMEQAADLKSCTLYRTTLSPAP